jgi:hypothetical protein
MKKKSLIILILLFSILSGFSQTAQPKKIESAIKITIVGFLKWYKENEPKLTTSAIVKGYNEDTIKKDSILRVDMRSVDEYLSNFRKSNFVSDSFLGALRFKYKSVSDSLTKYPVIDYFGPVSGLECDLLFGFEPEEILDHADEGKISKIFLFTIRR